MFILADVNALMVVKWSLFSLSYLFNAFISNNLTFISTFSDIKGVDVCFSGGSYDDKYYLKSVFF
jgi:hypothetical protein